MRKMSDKIWDLNEEQRKIALGAFRKFLKECAQSGFTVRQFEIIGILAHEEVMRMVRTNNLKTTIREDLFDLLQESDAFEKEGDDTQ